MSSAPFINFNRIHCPLGERLRSLRYRRLRQEIERVEAERKRLQQEIRQQDLRLMVLGRKR